MRAKGKRSSREQIFFLLVSMATLIVMATAVKLGVDENQHENPTETSRGGNISVNETAGNLTLEFDSGDLAYEQEKTKPKHQLTIVQVYAKRYVECRGENIKSLSAISCDTMETCEEQKSCLFDKNKCSRSWHLQNGRKCTKHESSGIYRSYSDYDADESLSCFRVRIHPFFGHCGIVQCTSEQNGENVTTFDHYNIAFLHATLLSTIKNVSVDMINMELYVSTLGQNLNKKAMLGHKNANANIIANVTLFVDEEVTLVECQVPMLVFYKEGIIIRVYRRDGSTVKLDSKMVSFGYSREFLKLELKDFRVSEDIVAFSCSAQRTNSSGEWLENWINVTVQALSSELIVKSSECRNMTVDLTSGSKVNLHCELTGPSFQKMSVRSKMRKMQSSYSNYMESSFRSLTEPRSKSILEFLRFYQVAGEHLICKELDEASETETWKTEHQKYYKDEQSFHFIFNLTPSVPKIYRPVALNQINSSSSSVLLIYQEDHVVDQTLFCMFSGEPEPVISWMKNGQELFSMKSMGARRTQDYKLHLSPENETLEHVKLVLDSETIQLGDFELSQNGSAHVNFSCVVRNYFGSDRLDFIIMMAEEFSHQVAAAAFTTITNFPVEHSATLSSSSSSTETLPSSTTTISTSTSTAQLREEENSNSSLTSKPTLSLERSDAVTKSKALVIVGIVGTAVKMGVDENQHENQTKDSTEEKISLNATDTNLTLDFGSGDLAYEQEKTKPKHQLTIVQVYAKRYVECRGENIKSLSAISCDTMQTCEEQKSCLFDQSKCSWPLRLENGRKCTKYESGVSSDRSIYFQDYDDADESLTCFTVLISFLGHSGIVQCTSEENGQNVTTFDHFTIGHYDDQAKEDKLLSTIKNVTVDMIKMTMFVPAIPQKLNEKNAIATVTLFVDEEVTLVECKVPKLRFHKGIIIRVHRRDGSSVKLGPKMTSSKYSNEFLNLELRDFRVPEDVVAFSCSAQKTNSSGQWLENWINVTVQALPSELIVKTSERRNMTVDLTLGSKVNLHCELTGTLQQKLSVSGKMKKMEDNSNSLTDPKSKSIVEFVRFYQVAGEHLTCKELDEASENSTWKTEHQKYYGHEQRFHFVFNLAPSAPKIYRPMAMNQNQINSSSSILLIFEEDHVVDQTLFCLFSGEPEPVITWMKNGQELFSMKSMGARHTHDRKLHLTPGNQTLEHVKLLLDAETIQPTDFDPLENGSGKPHVNFSCIASNYFGSDRLDFIMMAGKFLHE